LAAALSADAPAEAIDLYRTGLQLSPHDGHRWLALAELLEPGDPAAALEAYLQACRNGDPGANGCLRAGSLAEGDGDFSAAIEYYRLSKWSGALDRADELERQLVAGQP
jgi:tetratricopeptide (TPR) repeat protein